MQFCLSVPVPTSRPPAEVSRTIAAAILRQCYREEDMMQQVLVVVLVALALCQSVGAENGAQDTENHSNSELHACVCTHIRSTFSHTLISTCICICAYNVCVYIRVFV